VYASVGSGVGVAVRETMGLDADGDEERVGAAVPLTLRDGVRLALELPVCEKVGCNEAETDAEPVGVNVTLPLPLVLPLDVREALALIEPDAVLETEAPAERLAVCEEVPAGDGCNDCVTDGDEELDGEPLAVTVPVCR
jgi:hypothetical protein